MFKNKKVSVIGLGKSGISAVKLLVKNGAEVFISDKDDKAKDVISKLSTELDVVFDYEIGEHTSKILDSDVIVVSPGVSKDEEILKKAKSLSKEILSELELGYRFLQGQRIIAITGTNGKTTTATLVTKICQAYGFDAVCCGNIGLPITSVIDVLKKDSLLIVEVSSYQLELIKEFKANSVVVLNITPDHIEHHGSMEDYVKAKIRIFENQAKDDIGIFNKDDFYAKTLAKSIRSKKLSFGIGKNSADIFYFDDKIYFDDIDWIFDCKKLKIPGIHNILNVMASVGLCKDIVRGDLTVLNNVLMDFKGVEHRIEKVIEINEVVYVNDSKSTNVDSTEVALKSFENNIILLMGGRDKFAPYEPLIQEIKKKVKLLIVYGEGKQRIEDELGSIVEVKEVINLEEALRFAFENSSPKDVVLLSPACASFDQYKNFEERGKHFKNLVNKL